MTKCNGLLTQHRWCQWISRYHPIGVYDGEEGKLNDFTVSIPEYIVETIARPAVISGKQLVVLAEEWHTAESLCRISDLLFSKGLRDKALLLWNANNTYSFHRINWNRLKGCAGITTVSRYMRHLMKPYGVEPLVMHNGIQPELTEPLDNGSRNGFLNGLKADFMLFKMARFDPAKNWISAVETVVRLKAMGYRVVFFLRGGIEPFGREVLEKAIACGLTVQDVDLSGLDQESCLRELLAAQGADLVNITSYLSHDLSRVLYACSDAVLANSVHEPFGLVGLEAMAAGGTAYVGMTGEDYAHDFEDAVVLESSRSQEAVADLLYLHEHKGFHHRLREKAKSTAQEFTWNRIIEHKLLPKLERLSWEQNAA